MDQPSLEVIVGKIVQTQPVLHGAGTVSRQVLDAIVRHASTRPIRASVETGCGATTLLISQLSENHTVFALDIAASVTNVRRSPLLREGVVTFIEGPSQLTLRQHSFSEKLHLVLLDGPHAYPFPDLEYYTLYPHLATGALLILDDIQIPTINNLYRFLRRDRMFQLDEVVRSTAFFTRTDAPACDPLGDGWSEQGYNKHTLHRYDWRSWVSQALSRSPFRDLRSRRPNFNSGVIEILSPSKKEIVGMTGPVAGKARLDAGVHLWVLVHRRDGSGWWPQGGGAIPVQGGEWNVDVNYGDPGDAGYEFEIAAILLDLGAHEILCQWVDAARNTGLFPPVQISGLRDVLGQTRRTVRRT
jgi:hypothetical protein